MFNKIRAQSEFRKNVLTLMTGTTIAQAIPVAISPILTRIYTPEDFGIFALYMGLVMILGSIVTGRYELAILIPKNNRDAKHIVLQTILLSFSLSLILFLFVLFFVNAIAQALGNEGIKLWLYFLPLNIFVISVINILYYWKNRTKEYRTLSNYQILQSLTQGTTNVSFGLVTKLMGGLVVGTIVGGIIAAQYLIIKSYEDLRGFIFNKLRALVLFKKYSNFPKYMVPSGLLENLSSQLPIFLIGIFFGSNLVGFYALSQRVIRAPIMLMGSAIGNVFRQEASYNLTNYGNCRDVFLKTLKKLILIATIPFIVFYFISPDLFSLIFGSEWRVAGRYAQILTMLFYLQFVTSPLSSMFMIAEKQKMDLYMQVYLVVCVLLSFYIGHHIFNSIELSLHMFSFIYSIKYIFELIMSYTYTLKK